MAAKQSALKQSSSMGMETFDPGGGTKGYIWLLGSERCGVRIPGRPSSFCSPSTFAQVGHPPTDTYVAYPGCLLSSDLVACCLIIHNLDEFLVCAECLDSLKLGFEVAVVYLRALPLTDHRTELSTSGATNDMLSHQYLLVWMKDHQLTLSRQYRRTPLCAFCLLYERE